MKCLFPLAKIYGLVQKNPEDFLLNFYNTFDTGKGGFFLVFSKCLLLNGRINF